MKIKKAIFPVGGLGTRFLPATKSMPKEMLPIVDKPLIQYAVEEAANAGIDQFIFVTSRGKSAIENHFDHSFELENNLLSKGKNQMKIEIIKCLQDNYSYLIIDNINKYACVVDPGESRPIISFIENSGIKLRYILNTHHHYDHVGGNLELKNKYGSKIVAFEGDRDRIPGIDILVKDNQVLK